MRQTRRVHRFVSIASAALAAAVLAASSSASLPSLDVATTAGIVHGTVVGAENEWRGIPYAAPPVGALRFRPPVPATPWSGVRDATAFAPECIQLAPDGVDGSEDCLYLNVLAPASSTASSHLAVMVHLHPGSNTFGDAYQDAAAFTERNVIVVTVGYRLGVLGFVGHPALSAEGGGSSGEYGVLDQLAALHWVHDNIAAFGGDPSRVTLFGSSAGSFDTVALMASPLSQGLIARAAVQGEFLPFFNGRGNTIADAEQLGVQIAQAAGCGSSANVPACLRSLPAADLVEAAGGLDLGPWVGGTVLPKSPLELLATSGVPLLVGIDREENAFWKLDDAGNLPTSYTFTQWLQDTDALVGPKNGARARTLYPASAYDSLLWSWITMATDLTRGCPVRRMATEMSTHVPVWRYLYTHVIETDPYGASLRASHFLEEPFLWGEDLFGIGFTPAELVLSQRMTSYWTNFAKTGDPNGAGLPQWPQYNPSSQPALTLDDQIGVLTNYHSQQCGLLDNVQDYFPPPWDPGRGPASFPPGFVNGHAHAFPFP